MKTVNSISGGKTSAYLAANYQTDLYIFSLVTTNEKNCRLKSDFDRKMVSEKLGKEFNGTLEDDKIINTIFDLEQFLGKEIIWVSAEPFEDIVNSNAILPNLKARFCTTELKIKPIVHKLMQLNALPCKMQIGYRANEGRRVENMRKRVSENGFIQFKMEIGTHIKGRHKGNKQWGNINYCTPSFPLFDDHINKVEVVNFWKRKPVRFAEINNCIGCFHRNPPLLNKMSIQFPEKFKWFIEQEINIGGTWKKGITYKSIASHKPQIELNFSDFSECDSGHCEI